MFTVRPLSVRECAASKIVAYTALTVIFECRIPESLNRGSTDSPRPFP